MYKVIALLALVGACSAGVLNPGVLPVGYSSLGYSQVLPNAGLVSYAAGQEAVNQYRDQVSTQIARNQGAFASQQGVAAILQGNVAKQQGAFAEAQGIVAKQQGIFAQQQGIVAHNQGALSDGNVVSVYAAQPALQFQAAQPALYSGAGLIADGRIASVRDAAALNQQIATQQAINNQGALRNAGLFQY